jgi:hypothetical protein
VALTANSWQLEDIHDGLPEGSIVVAYHSEDVPNSNPNALEYLLQFRCIKGAIFVSGDRQDARAELLELEILVHVMQEGCKITTCPATFRLPSICRHGKLPTRLLARGDYVHNLLHACSCEIVEDSFDLLSAKEWAPQVPLVKKYRTFALGRSEVRQIHYHHVPNEIPGRLLVAPFAQAL